MSGRVETSTHLQDNEPDVTVSGGMKVALIGPNEAHRKIVAKALAGSEARSVREFVDYPANLTDLPKILEEHYDVIMIDVDSDQSYALKLVETVAGLTSAVVMVYSRRNDPDLLMNCMRAGARDFLPLPEDPQAAAAAAAASGPQLVQPEARVAPPAEPQTVPEPAPRPVPTGATHSFSAPPAPVEPPTYTPPIERGVPEQRIDDFPTPASFAENGHAHSLQQDIDEWDEAHLRAPEPSIVREPARPTQFSAAPAPDIFRSPEPRTFTEPRIFKTPEPAETPLPIESFLKTPEAPAESFRKAPEPSVDSFLKTTETPRDSFLKTPEPKAESFLKAPQVPVESVLKKPEPQPESFRKVSEAPVQEPFGVKRAESQPQPAQANNQAAGASSNFDEWDSAFLRTPQSSGNSKGVAAPPRATVTSIPRPQVVPAPKTPEPAPLKASPVDPFAPATDADSGAATAPPDTSILSASRPKVDRSSIPVFQYEVPEEEKAEDRKWVLWIAIAAGVGALACALVFVFANPFHYNATPASQQQQQQPVAQQSQPQTPTAWQPVTAPAGQPSPAITKPSAATPIASAETTVAAPAPVRTVSSGMMDAQLAAPSRIAGTVKAPAPVEDAPPAGFTAASMDSGSSNMPGAVFGTNSKKVTIMPGVHAISSGVAEGMLLRKVEPVYPRFAKDSHVSGTVVLKATISKTGTIQGLQAVSGPQILSEAAMNAVKFWRYRPYMLNDEPVDVQTTINVVFKLDN